MYDKISPTLGWSCLTFKLAMISVKATANDEYARQYQKRAYKNTSILECRVSVLDHTIWYLYRSRAWNISHQK